MVNNGINYQPQLGSRISAINSQHVFFFGRVGQRLTTWCRSDVDKQREQRLNRPLGADIQIILVILGANKKDRDHSMGPIWGGTKLPTVNSFFFKSHLSPPIKSWMPRIRTQVWCSKMQVDGSFSSEAFSLQFNLLHSRNLT